MDSGGHLTVLSAAHNAEYFYISRLVVMRALSRLCELSQMSTRTATASREIVLLFSCAALKAPGVISSCGAAVSQHSAQDKDLAAVLSNAFAESAPVRRC